MESELPGFDKEDITVDLNGNSLTLKAEHKAETEESKKGKYIRRERSYGSYERTFDIAGIDTENITADYKNGILTMVLPKKKPQAPASRKLTIN
ncbi:MAG: Hsp20/alpha crystallin family protein [Ruminococcus sp.]|nr:MAG: Hsp20/alpha crystallin family protein [Ruminococcus sp.]